MEKLKVAVVGCGGLGGAHVNCYSRTPNVEVVAICDLDPQRLEYIGDLFHVSNRYTDEAEMLAAHPEIDAVSVCTWNSAHAPCAIMALNAGKHVLCEKPMAMNAQEARAMQDAADRNGKILMIGFVMRFFPETSITKELIEQDFFGNFYYGKATYLRRNGFPGKWFGTKELSGGGPLIDLGVHVIDRTRYLLGNPKPVSVYGATFHELGSLQGVKGAAADMGCVSKAEGETTFNVEDLATATIRYDNGALITLEASFTMHTNTNAPCGVELFGKKAGVRMYDKLELFTTTNGYLSDIQLQTDTKGVDPFLLEINHFVDCIRDGIPCRSPGEDGIVIMQIIDAIYESARTGHEVIL